MFTPVNNARKTTWNGLPNPICPGSRRGNILACAGVKSLSSLVGICLFRQGSGKRGPGSPGKPCLECDLYQPFHIDFLNAMVEATVIR